METAKLLIDGYFDHRTADNYHLTVDDLLDFPKEDEVMEDAFFVGNSSNSSPFAVSGSDPQFSGNFTSRSSSNNHFSSELCIPYDDLGDLDWIPNFSTDDFHNLGLITGADTSSSETDQSATAHASMFGSYVSVPTKSRSKASRAAPREWSSRIRVFSPAASSTIPASVAATKKETGVAHQGRKCLHCGSEKTPQWRAGPMGPKTLCNACGVRYNSGRLVPEYRPAASPTFQPEKHSNSHRKVVEIRRQTEERRYQRRQ